MRVAIVNQHLADGVGGSELQCDLVARGLAARGHDVTHVAVAPTAGRGAHTGAVHAPDAVRPYRIRGVERSARAIVTGCVAERADVVYWRFNRALLRPTVTDLARRGVPLVFAVAHIDDVSRWPVRPWPQAGVRARVSELRARVGERVTWREFRRVRAVASQRADLLGRVPVADQRVVRNLMSDAFARHDHPRPYVAWVGSLQRRKRPDVLSDVAARLAPLGVDVLVAGELRDARYRDLLAAGGPAGNLEHLGLLPLARTIGLIAGARALVVTADEEGFANVLIQAWWHGTPTVSLRHDPDGLIVAHGLGASCGGDVPALVGAVAALVTEDAATAAARRARIAAFAHTMFDADRTLGALEALLRDAVSAP